MSEAKTDIPKAGAHQADDLPLNKDVLLRAEKITKHFAQGEMHLKVLENIDLRLKAGEIVALVGPSGSGKSTLLQILGLLDKPTSGRVLIGGKAASTLNDKERTKLRGRDIGFVYQFHHLLPEFTALENVSMPLIISGQKKRDARVRAEQLLTRFGLKDRMSHQPFRLSGGEQQRVAIARALAPEPKVLLADEPTGNLDPGISGDVFEFLVNEIKERGIAALIATHNLELAEKMDRILELRGGKLLPY